MHAAALMGAASTTLYDATAHVQMTPAQVIQRCVMHVSNVVTPADVLTRRRSRSSPARRTGLPSRTVDRHGDAGVSHRVSRHARWAWAES